MRKVLIAGNWKMNLDLQGSLSLADSLKNVGNKNNVEIVISPTFVSLSSAHSILEGSGIYLAAQDISANDDGAFTGEISSKMLKSVGVSHVIIGHSERRAYHNENNTIINKKIKKALESGLVAILCVGETLEERESGIHYEVVLSQIGACLHEINSLDMVVIAYEPVWAIGTGKTASSDDAQKMHAKIRGKIAELKGQSEAAKVRILYGGSVKPDNISELMKKEDIDGALVGGASLKADTFGNIINY